MRKGTKGHTFVCSPTILFACLAAFGIVILVVSRATFSLSSASRRLLVQSTGAPAIIAAPDDETIFVSVSAYRDDECAQTLLDMYHKADRPRRVFTGAVAYIKPSNYTLNQTCNDRLLNQYNDRIQRYIGNFTDAKGPCVARWHCSQFFRGEKYFMQIDSHMEFVPGWDTLMIDMLKAAPSKKAVITHYPSGITTPDRYHIPVICYFNAFNYQGMVSWEARRLVPNGKYRPSPLVAGGYFFTYGAAVQEVPYDPNLPYLFLGEETTHTARLWTHGWDIYAPTANLIFHHYTRPQAPKFWTDLGSTKEYTRGLAESLRTVRALLNSTADNATFVAKYPYGMGKVRSISAFWNWTGVDWKTRNSTNRSRFCV